MNLYRLKEVVIFEEKEFDSAWKERHWIDNEIDWL